MDCAIWLLLVHHSAVIIIIIIIIVIITVFSDYGQERLETDNQRV
jgi:hypothetical protein